MKQKLFENKDLLENAIVSSKHLQKKKGTSPVAAFHCKSEAEVLNKPTTESRDGKYIHSIDTVCIVYILLVVHSTGVKEAANYAGLFYCEEKGAEDLITFTAAKELDALLEVIHMYM